MVCGEYGYACFLVHLGMFFDMSHMTMSIAISLPSANCHVPAGRHLFSIRLDISDNLARLHRYWRSFDSNCAISVWNEYQHLEGT